MRTHHQSHEDVRQFSCQICDKAYRRPDDLKRHELTHSGTKPHVCSYCAKGFKQLSTLKNHEKVAHEAPNNDTPESPDTLKIQTFNCKDCNQVFKSRSTLRDHEIRKHGRKGDIMKCKWIGPSGITCPKDFTNPALLKLHTRTHTNERPFECQFCDLKFKSKFHMENHAKRHTKAEGQYLCLICAVGFQDPGKLKDHHMLHVANNETENSSKYAVWYACELCQKKFIRADLLHKHMKTHEAYNCAQCGKGFITMEECGNCERGHFDLGDIDDMEVMTLANVEEFIAAEDNQFI